MSERQADETNGSAAAVEPAPSARAKTLREELLGSTLTVDEVAYILYLDRTTVGKYLREGTLYGFQIGREWLVPEEAVRTYVQSLKEQGSTERRPKPGMAPSGPEGSVIDRVLGQLWPGKRHEVGQHGGDQFTGRSRAALSLAADEAARLGHDRIGTEHLLLGLLAEGGGLAALALGHVGVTITAARAKVEGQLGRGNAAQAISLTPRSKAAIDASTVEASRRGHRFVGTEHLLLGLLDERKVGKSMAHQVLVALNAPPDAVCAEVERLLSERPVGDEPPGARV